MINFEDYDLWEDVFGSRATRIDRLLKITGLGLSAMVACTIAVGLFL